MTHFLDYVIVRIAGRDVPAELAAPAWTIRGHAGIGRGSACAAGSSWPSSRFQIVHTPEGTPPENAPSISIYFGDADFVRTLGIEILSGRNFLDVPGGETDAFLVNEAAGAAPNR